MSDLDRSPLWQLTWTRMLAFLREPEAIFWVFAFPILLALALGIAFRTPGPQRAQVGVEGGPGRARDRAAARACARPRRRPGPSRRGAGGVAARTHRGARASGRRPAE